MVNKKEYKQPSMKVIELDSNDIICGSSGDPSPTSLYDYEVDYQDENTGRGYQW